MRRSLGLTAVAALALVVCGQPLWGQQPPARHPVFGHSLYSGTGFIATPDAFVTEGFLWGSFAMVVIDDKGLKGLSTEHSRVSGGVALNGWIEVGGMATSWEDYAAFGKLQLVKQQGIFPAMAAGVMNVTNQELGRFAFLADSGAANFFDSYSDLLDRVSIYGVMTYVVGPGGRGFPSWVVLSFGWGSGIFLKEMDFFDGGGTGGAFGAVSFDFGAADDALIRVTTEWDGFDLNVALSAWLAGLEFKAGVLSLDEGEAEEPDLSDPTRTRAGIFYNQAKGFVSLTLDARVLGRLPWIWTSDE